MALWSRLPPLVMAVIGMALLTGVDALVKALAPHYPTFQIAFLRYGFAVLWTGAVVAIAAAGWPTLERWKAHLGRAVLIVVTASSFYYALGYLPLVEVVALSMTAPIFTALFAAVFLKEPVRAAVASGIAAGFVGMLVIVFGTGQGNFSQPHDILALACALLSPITYALSVVLLRAQTAHEPVSVILLTQAMMVTALLAPLAALQFTPPSAYDWMMFAFLGLVASLGYLAFADGLSRMTAARFSVVDYTALIWAAILGYVFFAEVPALAVWTGAAFIVAGCLVVARDHAAAAKAASQPIG